MYKEKIINVISGEESFIDYTSEQIAEAEIQRIAIAQKIEIQAKINEKKNSAVNKLIDLGLTEEEVEAFLG